MYFDIWLYGTLGILFTYLWNVFKEYHGITIRLECIIYFYGNTMVLFHNACVLKSFTSPQGFFSPGSLSH